MDAGKLVPARVAVQAMQHHDPEIRRELRQFGGPVGDEAGGHDDQRRPVQPSRVVFDDDMGDGLRGLAQPHVVGEKAAEPVRPQVL